MTDAALLDRDALDRCLLPFGASLGLPNDAYTATDHETFPNQLYIHPAECIHSSACEPACPWQALVEAADALLTGR